MLVSVAAVYAPFYQRKAQQVAPFRSGCTGHERPHSPSVAPSTPTHRGYLAPRKLQGLCTAHALCPTVFRIITQVLAHGLRSSWSTFFTGPLSWPVLRKMVRDRATWAAIQRRAVVERRVLDALHKAVVQTDAEKNMQSDDMRLRGIVVLGLKFVPPGRFLPRPAYKRLIMAQHPRRAPAHAQAFLAP